MKIPAIAVSLVLVAFLGGCAGTGQDECRADWYQLGERDALVYGLRAGIDGAE